MDQDFLPLLRCPVTRAPLLPDGAELTTADRSHRYGYTADGIVLFAAEACSSEARRQLEHFEAIAPAYVANLAYPHTEEYLAYLDSELTEALAGGTFDTVAEICCGTGEGFALLGRRVGRGVGVDITPAMLSKAREQHPDGRFAFVQGDAIALPLADNSFDAVVMIGGVHHIKNRSALFQEVFRILKPGGRYYFREPVSDFILWRAIRAVIYRLSPLLDHETERPLLYQETVPLLERVGFMCECWRTIGFLGFCFFMNSDVLIFNRLFRFIPGIRGVTRLFARFDKWFVRQPGFRRSGLLVVSVARKPKV